MAAAAWELPAEFECRPGPRLVVEPAAIMRLGELARELGATRALVASDPGIVDAGHAAAGIEALEEAGLTTALFSDFGENPTETQVAAGAAAARGFRPDLLVGLGGGSSMDCAKGINFILSCGGRMRDYRGRGTATGPMLPSIAVPTTAGTGSETQSFTLVTDDDTGLKMACGDPRAAFRTAILDVNLTLTQPLSLAALTGVDALSHALESHVSRAATPASRVYSREAWRLLAVNLPLILVNGGGTIGSRSAVQFGAALAGLAIENSMLGAAHALANPLTAAHDVVHGQAVGLVLPHVVRFNGAACGARYAELLDDIGIESMPAAAGDRLAAWLTDLLAAAQWTAGFNPRPAGVTDLAALYEACR